MEWSTEAYNAVIAGFRLSTQPASLSARQGNALPVIFSPATSTWLTACTDTDVHDSPV
jgi:hypothetical protein